MLVDEREQRRVDTKRGWGVALVIVGILGFIASAGSASGGTFEAGLVAGLLNPLFVLGLPLGIWMMKTAERARLARCPECRGAVSKIAPACPHCGRPLNTQATST